VIVANHMIKFEKTREYFQRINITFLKKKQHHCIVSPKYRCIFTPHLL